VVAERGGESGEFGGYAFTDARLLRLALTHRSCGAPNNERLEFLGDAVLGLVIGELLYQRFPEFSEGELSRLRARLVSGSCLAGIAREMGIPELLWLGKGERRDGGARRKNILAGTLEAILGAIWLDGGLEPCRDRIAHWFAGPLQSAIAEPGARDDKTRLQEFLQARGEPLPVYEVTRISGPDHARCFEVSCSLSLLAGPAIASAGSRREAEKRAAACALALLGVEQRT
jgi:ribonuclease-3